MRLSIVIPCYNEAAVIRATYSALTTALAHLPDVDLELVFVDDGSSDATPSMLRDIQAADPKVRAVLLSRNFGHQVALTAGLEHSSGDAVVVMDADLQDPPELVPDMLQRWRAGIEVVYGVRRERDGESLFKRWTAYLFYRLINGFSRVEIPVDAGDFRLLDRKVVNAMLSMTEQNRYVRGMVAWAGFRQEPFYYNRKARAAGTSKYPLRRMLSFAADGILSFSVVPLRLAVITGFGASALAMLGILYALAVRMFSDAWVTGWTMLFIAIMFMGGIQLMFLGIIGEYLGRIYNEVKGRPLYLVRERLGFPEDPVER